MKQLLVAGLSAALVVGATNAGFAQQDDVGNWPERPVKIVVPYAPGGNTDIQARLAAEVLSEATGGTFVVENRPGAGGVIAAESVATAEPDGYTLFMATISQISIAPFTHNITYEPLEDFEPISIIGRNPFVLTVPNSLPADTLKEFVAYAKENPGTLSYGSGGIGGLTHLSAALFVDRADIDIEHIPYAGGAPALNDLLGGTVDMYSGSPSELLPHKDSDRIKFLAVSSEEESPFFPGVPPIADLYPGHAVYTWNGLVAPAGTPDPIIETISTAIQEKMQDPEFLDRLEQLGLEPVMHTPEEFAQQIRRDLEQWGPIIESIGIKPQ